ncbi:MAG: sodium/proton-translocating pyrophosphatase [Fimbriimonadaceae bacterium]
MLPNAAMASGGEAAIKLEFSGQDMYFLYASLVFGVLAIAFGAYFYKAVMSQSPGNEKMQEVGGAIRDGALAYLKQQVRTMAIFAVIIFAVLFALYRGTYGDALALATAFAFLGGVAASYVAGYVGMLMAVNANMRTAAAALTSYKKSLETAFQAGAVAGLLTVGMGLLGATIIFIVFKENATKLLIGFGFGGSLAALFMRVGGGIFTKAADVGADLVGKVEAGIPEDDPRNPAVIADNVGDNVGDCAGMAADVFESYEVTLVAAIVLGAATAAIFPQEIWIKLVLFAMMARGIGIIASIAGIFLVRGKEDIKSDPLTAIRKGFYGSAFIAILLTAGLAFYMLGGNNVVATKQLVPVNEIIQDQVQAIQAEAKELAAKNKVTLNEIDVTPLKDTEAFKALGLEEEGGEQALQGIVNLDSSSLSQPVEVSGYRPIDLNDKEGAGAELSIPNPAANSFDPNAAPDQPKYISLNEAYSGDNSLMLFDISLTQKPVEGQDTPAAPPQEQMVGPMSQKEFDTQMDQMKAVYDVEVKETYPATLYADPYGAVVVGIDMKGKPVQAAKAPQAQIQIFKGKAEDLNKIDKMGVDNPDKKLPQPAASRITTAIIESQPAQWWQFFACVVFGIVMAFVFEWLTDYYVGLHKRPVQEVGQVATAGPAPMIISGFAYGKESSVFSVFAIVLCLIAPILIFPPAQYGGYLLSFYGIALVGLGLLTTTGFILAMDTFGPISDNAQGVFEMSGAHHGNEDGARRVQLLDAAGNTTKALTKGFAIATAVVAAVALFHAFVEEGRLTTVGMRLEVPEIFLGMLIGGAAPYLFSAFSIQAVGRAAFQLIQEVRDQFRNDPGIMAGTSKPNYARCVAISTKAAQTELIGPGILAIAFPILVAFGFSIGKETTLIGGMEFNLVGAQALGGFLAGTILSGQLMAVLLANSGGMWDNSKKLIEDGLHGGKGTEAHKAAVVCDTVGDPFKDTAVFGSEPVDQGYEPGCSVDCTTGYSALGTRSSDLGYRCGGGTACLCNLVVETRLTRLRNGGRCERKRCIR